MIVSDSTLAGDNRFLADDADSYTPSTEVAPSAPQNLHFNVQDDEK